MPNSPIKSINDIKGKRLGFTNPGSTTQALTLLLLEKVGLKTTDVTMTATGGFGPGLTALENGGIDVMALTDPLTSKNAERYRVIGWGRDLFPPMNNVVGVATTKAMKEHGDTLRAIIRARRRGVEFMKANPKEAAQIIATVYKMEPAVIEHAISPQFADEVRDATLRARGNQLQGPRQHDPGPEAGRCHQGRCRLVEDRGRELSSENLRSRK
jgi:NitT/TauT family transport system substrate-binding protein